MISSMISVGTSVYQLSRFSSGVDYVGLKLVYLISSNPCVDNGSLLVAVSLFIYKVFRVFSLKERVFVLIFTVSSETVVISRWLVDGVFGEQSGKPQNIRNMMKFTGDI